MSIPLTAADRQSEIVLRKSEQPHRRTAEDCCLLGCRNRQCLDLPYTFERPHVEGIVASQQHALRLARGHQKLERRPSMHYGVEQELVQRRLRRISKSKKIRSGGRLDQLPRRLGRIAVDLPEMPACRRKEGGRQPFLDLAAPIGERGQLASIASRSLPALMRWPLPPPTTPRGWRARERGQAGRHAESAGQPRLSGAAQKGAQDRQRNGVRWNLASG